ncbi:MAG: Crp/Fnr family transcriptional regulator [Bacteroidia bacterium]|nr:Crp/Fnr family transcriptional regulator [Bacteroidia bacterium]MDW8332935.1 Crp/Fnr family transcriptional regulator [Bacteroidia bacterium]
MKVKSLRDCSTCSMLGRSHLGRCDRQTLAHIGPHPANRFKKGQILFFEGNRPGGLYCIGKGTLKLYKTGSTGKEQIIRLVFPGDILGYRALIADEPYSATAEALEDGEACFIARDEFRYLLDNNPAFSQALFKSLCQDLGLMRERLLQMAQKSARERLAETLLLLLESGTDCSSARMGSEPRALPVNLPREDLAGLAGASTETVIRLLAEFKHDGLVDFVGKRTYILKPRELERIAGI